MIRAEDEAVQSGWGDKDEQRSVVIDGLEDGKTILVDKELVLTDEVVVTTVDAGEGMRMGMSYCQTGGKRGSR